MMLTVQDKQQIKQELVARLKDEPEVRKLVVFGSFASSPNPQDLDVAVFQDSDQAYLPLALKYRRLTRAIARRIPLDILPFRAGVPGGWFLQEVLRGEVVYER